MTDKTSIRFLSFANDKEDAEKAAKLKEAAEKIENALKKEKALNELIEYQATPEEPAADSTNDTRSLFERLQEQRNKKREVEEESQKLSNLVTKLDDDDASYLNDVAKSEREQELRKRLEIHDLLEAKRLKDEERKRDEEQKLKESSQKPSLNRRNLAIRSRLSSLKVKPKSKDSLDRESNSQRSRSQSPEAGSTVEASPSESRSPNR